MKKKTWIVIPVILLILLILITSGTYTTYENEYTVVKQFGKIIKTNNTSGLRLKAPFVHSISVVPKATQIYDLTESEVITSDKKTMIVDAYVLWRVTDAKLYTSSLNANEATAQGRIDVIVYNAIKTIISSMTQEELIASRDTALKIEASESELDDVEINDLVDDEEQESISEDVKVIVISDRLIEHIGNQCDQYGIEITDVKIKVLDLPDENKEAVYTRMITERNNIAAAYKAQGESEAQKIKNATDKEVSVMLSEAQANADAMIAEGEAEYMKILSDAYNKEDKADFYLFTLQLDTIKESLSDGNTTVFLDKDSPVAQIFEGVK